MRPVIENRNNGEKRNGRYRKKQNIEITPLNLMV
jgi:hypothetical protein